MLTQEYLQFPLLLSLNRCEFCNKIYPIEDLKERKEYLGFQLLSSQYICKFCKELYPIQDTKEYLEFPLLLSQNRYKFSKFYLEIYPIDDPEEFENINYNPKIFSKFTHFVLIVLNDVKYRVHIRYLNKLIHLYKGIVLKHSISKYQQDFVTHELNKLDNAAILPKIQEYFKKQNLIPHSESCRYTVKENGCQGSRDSKDEMTIDTEYDIIRFINNYIGKNTIELVRHVNLELFMTSS
jgi:uncharacterized protein YbaR (Trm112 family)